MTAVKNGLHGYMVYMIYVIYMAIWSTRSHDHMVCMAWSTRSHGLHGHMVSALLDYYVRTQVGKYWLGNATNSNATNSNITNSNATNSNATNSNVTNIDATNSRYVGTAPGLCMLQVGTIVKELCCARHSLGMHSGPHVAFILS